MLLTVMAEVNPALLHAILCLPRTNMRKHASKHDVRVYLEWIITRCCCLKQLEVREDGMLVRSGSHHVGSISPILQLYVPYAHIKGICERSVVPTCTALSNM